MKRRAWAAFGVGAIFCALFTEIANVFVGAAVGVVAALTTAFVLADHA